MKKQVMVKAHRIAKKMVVRTKDYSIALSFALKLVWSDLTVAWTPREIQEYLSNSTEAYNNGLNAAKSNDVTGAQMDAIISKLRRTGQNTNVEILKNAYEVKLEVVSHKAGAYYGIKVTTEYNDFDVYVAEAQWNAVA